LRSHVDSAISFRALSFDHDAGKWREWTGSIWRENETGLAFHFARELDRDLAVTEPDKVRYVTSKSSFAGGVERFARSDPAFATTSEFWYRDTYLLGAPQRRRRPQDGPQARQQPRRRHYEDDGGRPS
jgi:hypothetical protein